MCVLDAPSAVFSLSLHYHRFVLNWKAILSLSISFSTLPTNISSDSPPAWLVLSSPKCTCYVVLVSRHELIFNYLPQVLSDYASSQKPTTHLFTYVHMFNRRVCKFRSTTESQIPKPLSRQWTLPVASPTILTHSKTTTTKTKNTNNNTRCLLIAVECDASIFLPSCLPDERATSDDITMMLIVYTYIYIYCVLLLCVFY